MTHGVWRPSPTTVSKVTGHRGITDGVQSGGWQGHWSQPAHRHRDGMVDLAGLHPRWYLLNDASLDTQEGNMALTAVKEDFPTAHSTGSQSAVVWDDDLRRRDQAGRASGLVDGWSWHGWRRSTRGWGLVDFSQSQSEAEQAMAVAEQDHLQGQLPGLQEWSEQGHHPMPPMQWKPQRGWLSKASTFSDGCRVLRRTCSPLHVLHWWPGPWWSFNGWWIWLCVNRPPTSKEVVEQGKAVLGGGATRTLASVAALEKIMEINQSQKGHPGVSEVDLEDRPTFGFGNSSRNQCVSTAALKVSADGREGLLRVHALDQGEGPLLFSIHTLRALGAVIDFSEDFVVFRTLSDRKGDPTWEVHHRSPTFAYD